MFQATLQSLRTRKASGLSLKEVALRTPKSDILVHLSVPSYKLVSSGRMDEAHDLLLGPGIEILMSLIFL